MRKHNTIMLLMAMFAVMLMTIACGSSEDPTERPRTRARETTHQNRHHRTRTTTKTRTKPKTRTLAHPTTQQSPLRW